MIDFMLGNCLTDEGAECCASECGRTHFDDEHMQIADTPSVANVLISQADWERAVKAIDAQKLLAFLDDRKADVELTFTKPTETDGHYGYWRCDYADPFTGRPGSEYGDTRSEALSAALFTITSLRKMREMKEAA